MARPFSFMHVRHPEERSDEGPCECVGEIRMFIGSVHASLDHGRQGCNNHGVGCAVTRHW
jgi:hypothetical protein